MAPIASAEAGAGGDSWKPSAAFVVLAPLRSIVLAAVAFFAVWWIFAPQPGRDWVLLALLLLIVCRGAWAALWRWCASYELRADAVRARTGVFRRQHVEIALARVQSATLAQSLEERLAGVGTLVFGAADGNEIVWTMIDRPSEVLNTVRQAIARRGGAAGVRMDDGLGPGEGAVRTVVLGLAGGIGSGKSSVARGLERRGALVLDSDDEAKAILTRPEVIERLTEWWGPSILDAEGRADRRRIADVVFERPQERQRLEALVHPILKAERSRRVQDARRAGRELIVLDAPLLFEAGVDGECDAVVFVRCGRETRLGRVRETRGWSDEELTRREKAQMDLEEKRRRCRFVIDNDGPREAIDARIDALLADVRRWRDRERETGSVRSGASDRGRENGGPSGV